jgi:galactose mutarotase-like enzyme
VPQNQADSPLDVPGQVPRIRVLSDDTIVEVAPDRGGLITRWSVSGREHLYLDEATLLDRTKSVRGGVPVLFPTPGKLVGDAWSWRGKSGSLKQHGFARNLAWSVVERGPGAHLRMRIEDDASTIANFPWRFTFELDITIVNTSVRIAGAITNRGDASEGPMPCGYGFHPYFPVSIADKARAKITSDATRAFDNRTGRDVDFDATKLDLGGDEVDLHLLDHHGTKSALIIPGAPSVALEGSAHFRRWVVWTLPQKPFVCLEPWSCPGDALNREREGDRDLVVLAAGERHDFTLTLLAI